MFAAEPLGESPLFPFTRIFRFDTVFYTRIILSVAFAHLLDRFFAYRSDVAAFVPTSEVVEQQQFFIFLPERTNDIVVHYIGYEILRQSARINDFFAALS